MAHRDHLRPEAASRLTEERESASAEWLESGSEPFAFERYVRVIRERFWIILACVAVSTAAAVLYVAVSPTVYEAESDLLISPVSRDAEIPGVTLIRESSDPSRDIETVARVVTNTAVAERARRLTGTKDSPSALLGRVRAEPVVQSNIIAITAQGDTALEASRLANAFGRAVVQDRTARLHAQVDALVEDLNQRRAASGEESGSAQAALQAQLIELRGLRALPDPTLRLENPAPVPTSPVAPRPVRSLAAGIFVGLVLGLVGAFCLEALDPRLRREEQLRQLTRLPVLGRVPRERRSRGPLRPEGLTPAGAESFRALRETITSLRAPEAGPRSIFVTGSAFSDGKSTVALNLAASLALADKRVILIEADLRRPSLAAALGVEPLHDVVSVALGKAPLDQALESYRPGLEVLLASDPKERLKSAVGSRPEYRTAYFDALFLPGAQALIDDAKLLADYVVIDSPPLTEVIDGLLLAKHADDVLIVTRLGRSRRSKILRLGEMLSQQGIDPVGIALIGASSLRSTSPQDPQAPQRPTLGARVLARR